MKQLPKFKRMDIFTGIAAGVFVGNFLFHAVQGNYVKGAVVGVIAVLVFYGIIFIGRIIQ